MLLSTLLAVATLAHTPAPRTNAPQMRVVIRDLDFDRREDVLAFVQRTRAASRDYCSRHIAIVTPDRMGDSRPCERGMSMLAAEALPENARQALIRSGQSRRLR